MWVRADRANGKETVGLRVGGRGQDYREGGRAHMRGNNS